MNSKIHNTDAARKILASATTDQTHKNAWPVPQPLENKLPPVEPFASELLPSALRTWVEDTATRMDNQPMDYAAVGAIVGLGSLVGGKLAIAPKRNDDWIVVPNLWGALIGRPSSKKSPSLNEMLAPIKEIERSANQNYDDKKLDYETQVKLVKLEQKALEDLARKQLRDQNRSEALNTLLQHSEQPEEPNLLRIIINDATTPKLGEILCENPNGVLLVRDELTGWLNFISREENGIDRAFYLECWDGKSSFTYDRIGRGTIVIPRAIVSVLGGIQPAKLAPYLAAQRNGTGDDGLIERLQLAVYPDRTKFTFKDQKPNMAARKTAYEVFQKLHNIPRQPDGRPRVIKFSGEAQPLFDAWYVELHEQIEQEPCCHMESHLAKYPSLMASLALILHIAEGSPDVPISKAATLRAVAWCKYLESHARRIYSLVDQPNRQAKALLLKLNKLGPSFTTTDFLNKGWSNLQTGQDVNAATSTLCEHGYLRAEIIKTPGRDKTVFHVNPCLLEA